MFRITQADEISRVSNKSPKSGKVLEKNAGRVSSGPDGERRVGME